MTRSHHATSIGPSPTPWPRRNGSSSKAPSHRDRVDVAPTRRSVARGPFGSLARAHLAPRPDRDTISPMVNRYTVAGLSRGLAPLALIAALASPAMSHAAADDDAMRLARRLMQIWETGDTSTLADITTPDIVYDDVPNGTTFEGHDGVRRYVGRVHAWAAEVEIEITRLRGGEESAVAEWVMRGVQDRPIPARVPLATNRRFEIKGVTVVEVTAGKISRAADYMDVLGFVLQIGASVELPGGVTLPPD